MIVSHQNTIKSILKDKHRGQYYKKDDLPDVVNTIVVTTTKNIPNDVDHETVTTFIAQYLHYSDKKNKYYFSLRRNKLVNRGEHLKMLKEFLKKSKSKIEVEVDSDKNIFIKNKSEDSGAEDTDSEVNTDELLKLEEELQNSCKPHVVQKYNYPKEKKFNVTRRVDKDNGPYGTQWFHEFQVDDELDEVLKKRATKYDKLRAIKLPEQRSKAWFAMRDGAITASDGGCVLDQNKHDKPYMFIVKKCIGRPFTSNEFCYHGKKLEEPATMVYAYRMNVQVEEFGLMMHPTIPFLGASPDGICNRYKLDGIHQSKFVGRMLEIKCPFRRKIKKSGPIKDWICPIYYWVQVQLQLECCDLEECDFWQCNIREYNTRVEFVADTDPDEPFRSKKFGYEKGCLIQLVPKNRMDEIRNGNYLQVVYDDAIFIYPKDIEMSPYDCDMWVADNLDDLKKNPKYNDYVFDKVVYWRIEDTMNVTIKRDREWFAESLPRFEQMWNYVKFFRKNKKQLDYFKRYLDSRAKKDTKNIMGVVDKLTKTDLPWYNQFLENLEADIYEGNEKKKRMEEARKKKKAEEDIFATEYLFI